MITTSRLFSCYFWHIAGERGTFLLFPHFFITYFLPVFPLLLPFFSSMPLLNTYSEPGSAVVARDRVLNNNKEVPFRSSVTRKLCVSDCDLNPHGQDENPTITHSLLTGTTHLVSGCNGAQVLDVSSQKEFSGRLSDRQEVNLFRDKHNPQTVLLLLLFSR